MQNLEHGQQYKNIKIKIMGSLSNLYISQSYQSLIHLATNNTASANLIELQDGLGNSIGVAVNTNGDLFLSGSLTASLQQGYLYVGNASGKTTAFATSSLVTNINTGSLVTTSSFNSYTQSTNIRLNNLESTSASVNVSISNLNSTTASQGVSITNLNSATSSLFTSASLALVTASFDNGTRNLTFTKGNTTQFSVNIPDVSGSAGNFVTTSSFNAYTQSNDQRVSSLETNSASVNISISNINQFTQSANISINALNAATSSYATSAITASSLITASVSLNTITFTKGDGTTFPITVNTGSGGGGGTTDTGSLMLTGSVAGNVLTFTKGDATTFSLTVATGSGGATIDTGSFATTGSNSFNGNQTITGSVRAGTFIVGTIAQAPTIQALDSGTPAGDTSLQVNAGASGSFSLRTLYGAGIGKAILEAYDTFPSYTTGGKIEALSAGGLNLIGYAGNIQSTAPQISAVNDNGFVVARQATLQGGVYMNTNSGSLILTPSGFSSTSGSLLHLSSSSNTNNVNLLFKNNNTAADTIISGSANMFINPAAPTAGFKRYLGGSGNIALNGSNVPQISSSMAFSPTMNNNYFGGNSTTLIMRGPVSASTYTISANNVLGTISIGSSAALNAEKLLSGLTLTGNNVPGTLTINANQSALTGSTPSITNNIIAGATTLNLSSSAASVGNNIINDSGFTLTNQYYSSSLGLGSVAMNRNNIGGQNNSIIISGSLPVGGAQNNSISDNFIFGGANTIYIDVANARVSGSSVYNNVVRTGLMGNNLIVSGSSLIADGSSVGSVFVGRYNANDNIRNRTSNTVFAVGTGNTTTRKTGFLIDSGSNTYVEGTLNVSGSTTLSGSLYIQSGSTLPSATGSSILTWNPTTGQVSQSPIATLISSSFSVGAFNSTITQSGSAAVSQSMTFNNTDISNGVSIVSNSQITLANTGTYNIQFSAQVLAATGQDDVYIWLKKNGTNVANTGTKLVLANNEADVAAWNFVITAAASDYFELAWQSRDGHTLLSAATATGNIPGIPSIILTVTQVE